LKFEKIKSWRKAQGLSSDRCGNVVTVIKEGKLKGEGKMRVVCKFSEDGRKERWGVVQIL